MKNKSRIISLILALVILLSDFGSLSSAVFAEDVTEPVTVEQDFIIEDGILTEISDKKKEEILQSHHVTIPDGVREIGDHVFQKLGIESVTFNDGLKRINDYSFANNNIKNVDFPDSVEYIGIFAFSDNNITSLDTKNIVDIDAGAFQNNKLTNLHLGEQLMSIVGGAFKFNDLIEVKIPEHTSFFGPEIFADNNRYVRITGDNPYIKTERVEGHFGHIVNSAIITVRFLEKGTNKEILSPKKLGEDLEVEGEIFEIGQEAKYKAPEIYGYVPVEKEVSITPKKSDDVFDIYYMDSKVPPTIKAANKEFKSSDVIDKEALLTGITATDFLGKDISSKLTVSPESLDATLPGFFNVTYSVTDDYGNTVTKTIKISTEEDWSKLEVGGGWIVGDFTYEGDTITGFSAAGEEKVKTNKDLYLPMVNEKNESVTTVKSFAFSSYKLNTAVFPYSIKYIEYLAFKNNEFKYVIFYNPKIEAGWHAFETYNGDSVTAYFIGNSRSNSPYQGIGESYLKTKYYKSTGTGEVDWLEEDFLWDGTKINGLSVSGIKKLELTNKLVIPDKATEIAARAFQEANLVSVIIPDSVIHIGKNAFYNNAENPLPTYNDRYPLNKIDSNAGLIYNPYKAKGVGEVNWVEDDFIWDGDTVLGIKKEAKNKLDKTSKLTIPRKATAIGDSAFYGFEITSVELPDSVTIIGDYAFSSNKLSSITIPDSITSIGESAFMNNLLTSVVIPNGIDNIKRAAFQNNRLSTITFPDGLTTIEDYAFERNQLISVIIPNHFTEIGFGAFHNNKNEKVIAYTPANMVPVIGYISRTGLAYERYKSTGTGETEWLEEDFLWEGTKLQGLSRSGIEKLKLTNKLVIPKKATTIRDGAFNDANLVSVVIPDGVTSIGSNAFSSNHLQSIIIPDSVTTIEYNAFKSNALTSVIIPERVTKIGLDAFRYNNHGFASDCIIAYAPGNKKSWEESFYSKTYLELQYYKATGTGKTEWLEEDFFWQGTKVLGLSTSGIRKLELTNKLVIPDRATEIGKSAFYKANLASVVIPNSVTNIGDDAFSSNQLTSVVIPDGMNSIGSHAFYNNKLFSVVIPDSVNSIGKEAFSYNKIYPLPAHRKGCYINETDTNIGLIYNLYKSTGDEDVEWVRDDFAWNGDTVLGIKYESRSKLDKTSKLIIPDGAKAIASNAFKWLNLTSVVIPYGVTSIGSNAFYKNQLTSVVIPDSVTSIGSNAFINNAKSPLPAYRNGYPSNKEDSNIGVIYNPYKATGEGEVEWTEDDFTWNGNTIIGIKYESRDKLNKTNKLVISNKATAIGNSAFNGLGLTSVIIPDSVNSIGESTFKNNKLTSVVIPDSVTSIGRGAFSYNPGDSAANNKVILNIKDSSNNTVNPNNLTSQKDYIINPKHITINYVNEDGETLLPKKEIITDKTDTFQVTDIPRIAGYKLPANVDVDISDTNKYDYRVDVVYKKYTKEELTEIANRTKSMKFKHETKGDKNYYIGDTMISYIYFDLSGFDANISGYKIRIPFNPDIFDASKIKVTKANLIKNAVVKEGEIELTIGEAYGGSSLSLPIEWAFKKYKTPADTPQTVKATIYDDKYQLYAMAEDTSFIGHYNYPNLTKKLTGEYNGYVVSNNIDKDGYLTIDEVLEYRFNVTNVDRNIAEYTLTDTLPTYKNQLNETVTATFRPEENPGWKLSEDGKTVVYTGNANGNTNVSVPNLKIRMPGIMSYVNVRNEATVKLMPHEMSTNEKALVASDYAVHYFKKPEIYIPPTPTPPTPPPAEWTGVEFDKDIRMPHYASSESQAYFYDIDEERNSEFLWDLSYRWNGRAVKDISITDKELDERMYYTGIMPSKDFIGGEVEAFDKDGTSIFIKKIENTDKIDFPSRIARDITSIKLKKDGVNNQRGYGAIRIYTKLRNTESLVYDETAGSTKNVFNNKAVMDFKLNDDGLISIISEDNVVVRWLTQIIKAYKSTSFSSDNHYTGDKGSYTVGVTADSPMIADEMTDFELIDLLPNGLNIDSIELYEPYRSEPTRSYEIIENYNNSGQTAIVFKAEKLKFEKMFGDTMSIAKINVSIDELMPTGTFTNDVFLKVSNPDFKIHNTVLDNRIGPDKYSKASVSNKVLKAEELIARKYIKKASETYWSKTGIFTDSLEKFEYKLTIFNGTPVDRKNVQIIDILPYVGDTSLTANKAGEYIARESKFANTFDYEKGVQAPDGYKVYYLNTPWQGMTDTMDNLDKTLNWEKTPTKDTSAVKIVAKDGVILKGYSQFDVIIPMVAPENKDLSLSGQKAWNTYVRKDDKTIRFIEPNRVYNLMSIPDGTITLHKKGLDKDFKTMLNLSGAVFELRDSEGNFIKTAKSDANGLVKFTNVDLLKDYVIKEISAPEGYSINSKEIVVTGKDVIAAENYVYDAGDVINSRKIVPLEPIIGDVKFIKTDAYDAPLSGARFNIKGQDKWNNHINMDTVSDKNGAVMFTDLPTGKYVVTEVQAPGHLKPVDPINVSIGTMKQVVDLGRIKNDKAQVTLTKIGIESEPQHADINNFNNSGKPLAGAEFALYKGETLIANNIATNNNGKVELPTLNVGEIYKLKETKVPDGYLVLYKEVEFKIDKLGNLVTSNGDKFITDNLVIPNLEKAKINLTKIGVEGQYKDTPLLDFKGSEGKALAGVKFDLYNGETLVKSNLKTDSSGQISVNQLDYDVKYTLKETGPLPEYFTMFDSIDVELKHDGTVLVNDTAIDGSMVYVPNLLKPKLNIIKLGILPEHENKPLFEFKGIEGNRLANAEFSVYKDNELVLEGLKTNSKGEVLLTDLQYDTEYTLKETKPPKDYLVLHKDIKVEFKADGSILINGEKYTNANLYIPNLKEEKESKVEITKTDSKTKKALAGAVFRLVKIEESGKETFIAEQATDSNGKLTVEGLKFGSYRLEEAKAPGGYKKSLQKYIFAVDKYTEKVFKYSYENIPIDFNVKKVSYVARAISPEKANELKELNPNYVLVPNKKLYDVYLPLGGVKFNIINLSNNEVVESVVSDVTGKVELNSKLYDMDNNYRIVETEVPRGYELNKAGWDINLKEMQLRNDFTGKIKMVLNNRPLKGQLIVSKYEKDGKTKLDGVEFTLYDEKGNIVKKMVTDYYGLAKFTDIDLGTYYLQETGTQAGYAMSPKKVKVVIDDNNLVQSYVFYNKKQVLPITGLQGAGLITITISSLITAAFVLNNKKKEKVS